MMNLPVNAQSRIYEYYSSTDSELQATGQAPGLKRAMEGVRTTPTVVILYTVVLGTLYAHAIEFLRTACMVRRNHNKMQAVVSEPCVT